MISNFQLEVGDVCGDPTGLRVKVVDVDVYDYVHFSVVESSQGKRWARGRADVSCGVCASLHEGGSICLTRELVLHTKVIPVEAPDCQ